MPALPTFTELAKVSKQQGVAVVLALALLGGLLYIVRIQSVDNGRKLDDLSDTVDALGDLVISACGADTVLVKKFEEAKHPKKR
jgi:hypothetical protein